MLPEYAPLLEPFVPDGLDVRRFGRPESTVKDGRTRISWRGRDVVFGFTARHQVPNAAAALTAAEALGLEPPREPVDVEFSRWRSQEVQLPGGGLLVNDAWNANPVAMRAALAHLLERADGRRTVAVLGDMAELGPEAARFHDEIGEAALDVDVVVGVGELARGYSPDQWVATAGDAVELVTRLVAARRRDPREGLALGRARSRCGRASGAGVVIRVLIAAGVALIVSLAIGPRFIEFLRRNEFGQHIREEGPQHHLAKQGTPTMGGLLILFAATVGFLPVNHYPGLRALTVLFTALACGAIGFLDDFIKLTHKRSLGLPGRWKLILLAVVTAVVGVVAHHLHLSTGVYLPVVDVWVPLSYAWYPFLFLIIGGASNGTNLADGADGLLAGTAIVALFTFTAMNVVSYVRSGRLPPSGM